MPRLRVLRYLQFDLRALSGHRDQFGAAAEKMSGIEIAENEIGVGPCWLGTAATVAGWARDRTASRPPPVGPTGVGAGLPIFLQSALRPKSTVARRPVRPGRIDAPVPARTGRPPNYANAFFNAAFAIRSTLMRA